MRGYLSPKARVSRLEWDGWLYVKAAWQDPEPQTKGLSRTSQGYGETELSPEKQLKAETKENQLCFCYSVSSLQLSVLDPISSVQLQSLARTQWSKMAECPEERQKRHPSGWYICLERYSSWSLFLPKSVYF